MMTMDISPDQVEYIARQLKTRAVTYRSAARDLSIHVNQAKLLLHLYYNAHRDNLTVSFVASGTKDDTRIIKLIQDPPSLDKKLSATFDKVDSVHVYCFTLAEHALSNTDIALEELSHPVDISNLDHFYDLGLIRGPDLKTSAAELKSRPRPSERPSLGRPEPKKESSVEAQPAKKQVTDTDMKQEPKAELKYQSRKEKPKPSLLSNYVSRKGEKQQDSKTTPAKRKTAEQKPSYQYKSRKAEKSEPQERVVISSLDNQEDEQEDEPAMPQQPPPPKTSDLNSLFVDDMSDFSDEDDNAGGAETKEAEEPIAVEQEENDEEEEEKSTKTSTPVPTRQHIPEDSALRSLTKSPSAQADAEQNKKEQEDQEKPETAYDDEGYMVTRKPASKPPAQSSSSSETKSSKASNKPKPKQTTKKNQGKMKQTSLMSFFGK